MMAALALARRYSARVPATSVAMPANNGCFACASHWAARPMASSNAMGLPSCIGCACAGRALNCARARVARGQSVPVRVNVSPAAIERRSHNSGQNGHVQDVGELIEVMSGYQQLICHPLWFCEAPSLYRTNANCAACMRGAYSMCFAPRAMQTVTRRSFTPDSIPWTPLLARTASTDGMEHEYGRWEAQSPAREASDEKGPVIRVSQRRWLRGRMGRTGTADAGQGDARCRRT